jgi:hypothetical protein
VEVQAVSLEIDDRVSDELSRSVKCHVAAALDLEELHALAVKKLGRRDEMFSLGRPAERDYRWVFDEEQHILRERARDAVTRDVPLQLERFLVGDPAQRNSP